MKGKKHNGSLRDLFRHKLENAGVIPDKGVKAKLMRRVKVEDFLRFNPSRFNIFYVGGIIAGLLSTALLLLPSLAGNHQSGESYLNKPAKTDSLSYLEIPAGRPYYGNSDNPAEVQNIPVSRKVVTLHNIKQVQPAHPEPDSVHITKPQMIVIPIPNSGISLKTEGVTSGLMSPNSYEPDALLIDPTAFVGCAPAKVRFHIKSAVYDSCRWTFGDGGYSTEKDPQWIYDVDGMYKVTLQLFRPNGKILTSYSEVMVHPRPQAHFEINPPHAVLPADEISFLNYSVDATRFMWKFGDGTTSDLFEPRHTYSGFANYNVQLTAYSGWGCADSVTVFNAFSGSSFFIEFPNAFIPNNLGPAGGYYSSKSDEAAQVFHPSSSGVSEYHLKIFSKLGILIFESNEINIGWDGYNKGQLSDPGVYIWKVRGKFTNNETFVKMGDVTLLKN